MGMGALNRLGILPICGDECIAGGNEILSLGQAGIIGGVNLKLIKAEGVTPLLRAAALCSQIGLSVTLAGKVAGSSISAAATLIAACASPVLDWGVNLTHVYLAEDLVRDPLRLEDGTIALRAKPGLGVDVDEDAVRRFTVS
jgi:muconate cycloisomerase